MAASPFELVGYRLAACVVLLSSCSSPGAAPAVVENAGSAGATSGTPANSGGAPVVGGSGGGLGTVGGVAGAAGTGGVGGTVGLPGDWFDPAWTQRRKVTVSDPLLTEELQQFQLPVRLDAQSFDYASARAAGEDLRFVTIDGVVLKHEIEKWDPVGGSLIWLMLPKLGATPVELWLYSGNSVAPALTEADRRAVWPAPYSAVWHMAGDVADSSPSAYGAKNMGGTFTEAKFGQGLNLSRPSKQYVIISPNTPIPILSGADGSTFSAWLHPVNIDGGPSDGSDEHDNGSIVLTVGGHSTGNHNSYSDYNVSYEGRMISHIDPGDQGSYRRVRSNPGVIQMNEWTWVTYVVDLPANVLRFYKDGQAVGPFTEGAFNDSKYASEASLQVVIGTEEDLTKHFWDGGLDELRVEKGMRSASWIAAQYRAMTTASYVTVSAK